MRCECECVRETITDVREMLVCRVSTVFLCFFLNFLGLPSRKKVSISLSLQSGHAGSLFPYLLHLLLLLLQLPHAAGRCC